jgi:Uma2 family endonuclease
MVDRNLPWLDHPLTEEQAGHLFFMFLDDDSESTPWRGIGDMQFWSASSLAHSLRIYRHEQGLPWYVASMLPITFVLLKSGRKKTLAPDVFVAFVPDHPRDSYDVAVEGRFPEFVLEVVSPSSEDRDKQDKVEAYEELGALEFALFTPRADGRSGLEGYRRNAEGRFEPWPVDAEGRLHSRVLNVSFVVRGTLLQAQAPDGRMLLTPEQAEAAWRRAEAKSEREAESRREAEAARRRAETETEREAAARREVEAEVERLRQELDRLRRSAPEV